MAGNVRLPDSVRGLREGLPDHDKPDVNDITPPSWLTKTAKKEFRLFVKRLAEAGVPLKTVDVHSVAMASMCVVNVGVWSENEDKATDIKSKIECSKLIARYQREAQLWLNAICATPLSRARIGLRTDAKKDGPLASLLKAKANAA